MAGSLPPVHPGEILREEFMAPDRISINALARDLHVPPNRISELVNRRRGVTASTALRLARYFDTTPQFWLNLQMLYDLEVTRPLISKQVESEVKPRSRGKAA
jgi:addiction module HigA family antidote